LRRRAPACVFNRLSHYIKAGKFFNRQANQCMTGTTRKREILTLRRLLANLSRNQSGLAVDMIQLFNLSQYVKRTDTDYNPAAKDLEKKKLDSLMKLNFDSNTLKGKTDSPKTTKPN
jgi:hypothetical protein